MALPATGLTATTIVRLRAVSDFGLTDIGLDNVRLEYVSCAAVTGLTATAITPISATISFNAAPGSSSYVVTTTPAGGTATTQTITASSLALSSLLPNTVYVVSVVNSCGGGLTSQPTNVTFTTPSTPPANDDCAGAITIPVQFGTCTTQTLGTNVAATNSTGVTAPTCGNYQGGDIWFKITVPASGTVTVSTAAPTGGSNVVDTGLSVYSGTCATLTDIGCNDDIGGGVNYSQLALTGPHAGRSALHPGVGLWQLIERADCNVRGIVVELRGSVRSTRGHGHQHHGGPELDGSRRRPAHRQYLRVEFGPQGFVPGMGTGTVVTAITNSLVLASLLPNTAYCYYVRQNCGTTNGSSTYVGPTCFTTPQVVPTNDDPCGALGLGTVAVSATNVGATTTTTANISTPACAGGALPKDVWFTFVASATTSTLTFTGTAAGAVRVYSSPSCSAGPFTLAFCQGSGANNTSLGRRVRHGPDHGHPLLRGRQRFQ